MVLMRKEKKNYLTSLIVALVLWIALGLIVWLVPPELVADWLIPGGYVVFFGVVFLAILFSASLILMSTRRGLMMAFGIILLGYLRLLRIDNGWSGLLLVGVLVVMELFFWGRGEKTMIDSKD